MVVAGLTVIAVSAAVTGILLTGESDDSESDGTDEARTVQPGAPGEESRELSEEDVAGLEAPEHSQADVTFMQDMIVHHQQALDMVDLVDGRSEQSAISLLAERIQLSQESEIEQMEQWLTDRDEDIPEEGSGPEHDGDHELMPGMATAAEMDELEQSDGAAFDRLFLELMIAHHEGALEMVNDLYASGGGLEPAADLFALGVEADQTIEIGRMQDLLDSLE